MHKFNQYVWEFYGYHGLYPMGASREVIDKACAMVSKDPSFSGDTADRERVRKFLEGWGYGDAKRPELTPDVIALWLKQIVVDEYAKDPEDRDWYAKIGKVIDRLEEYNGN